MSRFETASGAAVPAVTAAEMRRVDEVAVEDVGLGLLQMMENAGRALAARARTDGHVVVLAGGGGNGGGGLCGARHLANHGHEVTVVLDRAPADLDGAPARQYRILDAMGVPLADDAAAALADADLAIDALVGYSLSGAPRGRVADLIAACSEHAARVLSLDVPTGRDATTGETPGVAISPAETLTLALPKTGLVGVAGEVWLADIAIPAVVYERAGVDFARPFDGEDCVELRE